MISARLFVEELKNKGIHFFSGVPDSLLSSLCAYLLENASHEDHIIAANEGGAIGLAVGYHLATGGLPVVYMQNSGQGNALNPLASLADPEVYGVPLLLIIGWRGEPGKKDEPQHVKQGKITTSLLDVLAIPWRLLPDCFEGMVDCVNTLVETAKSSKVPVALIVQNGTFDLYPYSNENRKEFELSREEAVQLIVDNIDSTSVIVSTTGKTSRELYEYRDRLNQNHSKDFLTVGSMGHASQIALGIALRKPQRIVYCLDGDGAALMHLGGMGIIGSQPKACNLRHIIINNGSHDSVGGQPTVGLKVDFRAIATSCGYRNTYLVQNISHFLNTFKSFSESAGPSLMEIRVHKGARSNLGRPAITPEENKDNFMQFLRGTPD